MLKKCTCRQAFNSMDSATLIMQSFHVHFIGEPAVGGGLVSDFYLSFFSGLSRCVGRLNCSFLCSSNPTTSLIFW